jgi:hypothetical protein
MKVLIINQSQMRQQLTMKECTELGGSGCDNT